MRKLVSITRSAVDTYSMIDEGDKIAVGVSGGKDSVLLLLALAQLKRFYPKSFELFAVTIDPQFGGISGDYEKIENLCREIGVTYKVVKTDLYEIVFNVRKESNPCSLCAKMRRGALHDAAKSLGCNKVALGHHLDDAVETFYMNLLKNGTLGSFQPKSYLSRKDLYLIRPFAFCEEHYIESVAQRLEIPIVKSKCPADKTTFREETKQYVKRLSEDFPDIKQKTIKAMQKANLTGW